MLHPKPKEQQELKGMEYTVFHSTQETTAAPSCPNFYTLQLHSVCFVCWLEWLVVGLGFPLLKGIKNLFSIMTMTLLSEIKSY